MPIVQPLGSIKLTNLSQVRMRKGKKRYEIICYQNKVQDWRRGVEKDLDEVIQLPQVFVNAGKGEVASSAELQEAFGTSDVNQVVLEILQRGELQVGGKERQLQQTEQKNKVLELVAGGCVNTRLANKPPYPASIINKALNQLGFQYSASKPVKVQALEAIKLLLESQLIPIARARMLIRVADEETAIDNYIEDIREKIEDMKEQRENGVLEITGTIDPGDFRVIDEIIRDKSQSSIGEVEVIALK